MRLAEISSDTAGVRPVPASSETLSALQWRLLYCSKLAFTICCLSSSIRWASFPFLWRSEWTWTFNMLILRLTSVWHTRQTSFPQSADKCSCGSSLIRWSSVTLFSFVAEPWAMRVRLESGDDFDKLVLCSDLFRAIAAGVPCTIATPSSSSSSSPCSLTHHKMIKRQYPHPTRHGSDHELPFLKVSPASDYNVIV